MERKIDKLRALMDADDWPAAIRSAAKFPRLGEHCPVITRARYALNNPEIYMQIQMNPVTLTDLAIKALKASFDC